MRQTTEPSEDRVLDRSEMARIQELWNPENEGQRPSGNDPIEKETGTMYRSLHPSGPLKRCFDPKVYLKIMAKAG